MKALRWTAIVAGALVVLAALALLWIFRAPSATRWIAGVATDALAGKLAIESIDGTLVGPLTVRNLRYVDPESGVDVSVATATVDLAVRDLLSVVVHVESADIAGVRVRLSEPTRPKPPSDEPFSLEPPVDIVVDRFALRDAAVERDRKPLAAIRTASLSGRWTSAGIAVRELEVDSPQGRAAMAGDVRGSGAAYIGRADGTFRWKLGELDYAGRIGLVSDSSQAKLDAELAAPVRASLALTLGQGNAFPWSFDLRVPRFDPRARVMPDSSLQSLAAALRGRGDRDEAEIRGELAINGQPIRIDPLRVTLADEIVDIRELRLRDATDGVADVSGRVRLDVEPFLADLAVKWRGVHLPPEWVGQELRSNGALTVKGNPSTFSADGDLAIGPPGRLADVKINIDGTPAAIDVHRLSIVQRSGNLTAGGRLGLQPSITWKLGAEAKRFDPGAFLAGWPGRLDFKLITEGALEPAGPRATLNVQGLNGTLRRRALQGTADLALKPDRTVAGTLRVRSGGSRIEVTGRRGAEMDLDATFDVATLDDWLPGTQGRLSGGAQVRGNWPDLQIDATVAGRGLAMTQAEVASANLEISLRNPQHPSGAIKLALGEATVREFDFRSITLAAEGDEKHHTLQLEAQGGPLSARLSAQGSRENDGWAGSLDALHLEARDIAALDLQEPVRIAFAGETFSIAQSCLRGDRIAVCLAAERNAAGTLQARYTLERLPLRLIASLANPDLPLRVSGTLEGRGELRRDADGSLHGDAVLSSDAGRVFQPGDRADPLLTFENFRLAANLAGDSASGSIAAQLGGGGSIDGEAMLSNLTGADPAIQGRVRAVLTDLSPIEIFTAQVADVGGRGELEARIGGSLMSPQITGTGKISDLSAEVPRLAIKLREGAFEASMDAAGNMQLGGRMRSGEGQVDIKGSAAKDEPLRVALSGKDFLGADIPGARVVLSPDLQLVRTEERIDVTGTVTIPSADIDVTKLPEAGPQRASPDVVVVDDPAVEQARETPIYADITVRLGNDVSLVGFGLDATLSGQLGVREIPHEETTGAGEIRVAGKYKAYGQDLTIQTGRLLFANTPLSNPQINLTAIRQVQTVTAKLIVTGSAQRPQLSVSADPAMSQTEALSYLVTGKPMNSLGEGEGDLVQSAARSVGGAAGNLLAKGIGRRLGIDEIGVDSNEELGGSAFTIGQYLSPRLYLSYGVGIFEPGQVVTLRYKLSRKLSLEASQGPKQQKAGLNYKVER